MWELVGIGTAGGLATLAASAWALWERGGRYRAQGDVMLASARNADLERVSGELSQDREALKLRLEEVIAVSKEREHDLTSALEVALGPGAVGELLNRLYGSQGGSPAYAPAESVPSGGTTSAASGSEVDKPGLPEVL
jgi:hypothetical protein